MHSQSTLSVQCASGWYLHAMQVVAVAWQHDRVWRGHQECTRALAHFESKPRYCYSYARDDEGRQDRVACGFKENVQQTFTGWLRPRSTDHISQAID